MYHNRILKIYQKYNVDPFYKKYGDCYQTLLCHLSKNYFRFGPMRYISRRENYQLVGTFLKTYFQEIMGDYEQQVGKKIQLHTVDELEEFIKLMEDEEKDEVPKISNMTVYEAQELLGGCGGSFFYINKNMWQLHGVDQCNLSSGMTVLHEFTHKLEEDFRLSKDRLEDDILAEIKAYYATFLLAEYASSLGLAYDATLALEQISFSITDSLRDYQKVMLKTQFLSANQIIEDLENMFEDNTFALNDYHHVLGYVFAKYYYHEQDGKPLQEKCRWLEEAIIQPDKLSSSFQKSMNQDMKNKELVKVYADRFKK